MSAAAEFDATDRPSAGTACVTCRTAGHFCPAKGYRGEDALCLACGYDEQCDQAGTVERVLADVGWGDQEIDQRGLHGECRRLEISEADRILAEDAPVATAWSIKASLSAENLVKMRRVRPEKVKRTRVKKAVQLEKERDAGRRRRMSELEATQETQAPAAVQASPAVKMSEANAREHVANFPAASVALLARATGWSDYHITKFRKELIKPKALTVRAKKASTPASIVQPAVEPEMVSVRLPAAAMDKLILMLPTKIKVLAVEKLMAELAGA